MLGFTVWPSSSGEAFVKICISHLSALEYYCAPRISREAYVERRKRLADAARTSRLAGFGAVTKREAQQLLPGLGVFEQPYHVLREKQGVKRDGLSRHEAGGHLPPSSLVRISKGFLVASPELVFVQVASYLDEIRLVKVGYELTATYGYVASADDELEALYDVLPLSDTSRIEEMLQGMAGSRFIRAARSALRFVAPRSASPMETTLAMLLSLPPRLGGLGFEVPHMNEEVQVSGERRRIDLYWPDRRVGVEYMGKEFHGEDKAEHDDRRQNLIQANGMLLLNVRYSDVVDLKQFQRFAAQLGRALGRRVRIRDRRFVAAHERLRRLLLG